MVRDVNKERTIENENDQLQKKELYIKKTQIMTLLRTLEQKPCHRKDCDVMCVCVHKKGYKMKVSLGHHSSHCINM